MYWKTGAILSKGIFADKEYPVEIERAWCSLLPILRTAKRMERYKDQSRMNYDKVVIQGKDYTLNNLHELPEDINCFKATSKSDDETVGFFGEANPLSNFHPAKFIPQRPNIYVSLHLRVQNAVPRSTLCWKIPNISGSIELFAL